MSKEQKFVNATYERVVSLLNEASLESKDQEKLRRLKIVEELILKKEPNLLDNFLDETLAFQTDKSLEIKKFVIHFMEVSCKYDPQLLPRIIMNITIMIATDNVGVLKKLILSLAQIYRTAFKWVAESKGDMDVMKRTWNQLVSIQGHVMDYIDAENEGLRTHAIKFFEVIIITLSKPPSDNQHPSEKPNNKNTKSNSNDDDVNLTLVPEGHAIFRTDRLIEEGKKAFSRLMAYQSSLHISSINLMTVMGTMTTIVRLRPQFVVDVVQGFESLHVNLPPTLTNSQVSSVRKHLKMQLLALLRMPACLPLQSNIAILLTDLGATQNEVIKNMVRVDERKRKVDSSGGSSSGSGAKKARIISSASSQSLTSLATSGPPPPSAAAAAAATATTSKPNNNNNNNNNSNNKKRPRNDDNNNNNNDDGDDDEEEEEEDYTPIVVTAPVAKSERNVKKPKIIPLDNNNNNNNNKNNNSSATSADKANSNRLANDGNNNNNSNNNNNNNGDNNNGGGKVFKSSSEVGEIGKTQSAIDITADDLVARLTPHNVADLVLLSMVMLPNEMPALFQSTYTPIAVAGTAVQIRHMARLLAAQLTNAGLGKGVEEMKRKEEQKQLQHQQQQQSSKGSSSSSSSSSSNNIPTISSGHNVKSLTGDDDYEDDDDDGGAAAAAADDTGAGGNDNDGGRVGAKKNIETVLGGATTKPITEQSANQNQARQQAPIIPSSIATVVQPARKGIVQFRLESVTKPMLLPEKEALMQKMVARLIEHAQSNGSDENTWNIIINLASRYAGELRDALLKHIFTDARNNRHLATQWIYQLYNNYQDSNANNNKNNNNNNINKNEMLRLYEECVLLLLNGMLERQDQKESLFRHLILDVPMLTPPIIQALKEYCISENQIYLGMTILKEMIVKRPCVKFQVLDVLLDLTVHEKTELRQNAIRTAKNLYEKADLKDRIEERALMRLKALLMPTPPPDLIKLDATTNNDPAATATNQWTEESIRLSLYLYLTLLPSEHQLIHQLASIYTASSSEIKRTILRVLEGPVKGMGMDSPELLLLVENCPKGAETLVTRVIHILTDKAMPSVELVDRVRDLYNKRVSDVRFLIPVLNGLSKSEVVTALPRLIKLNPVVVKEVFNRLLGVNGQENMGNSLNPIELLVTLHTLDSNKVDMKTIIKACNLCFAERSVYTQDTLALVIQQLLDLNPLPTLIMRTVIQALATYPRLTGFVINIMQRLLTKQVWKNKKVWEGFVRCCQRTKPQSFQILLQLQPAQLKDSFTICPDLREALLSHIMSFNPHQRAHIPKSVMSLIEKPLEKPTVVTLSAPTNVNSDVEAKKFVSEDSVGVASGLEIKDEQVVNLNADDHKVAEDTSSSSDVTKQTSPLISITLQKMAEGPKLMPEENLESCGDGKEDIPGIVR